MKKERAGKIFQTAMEWVGDDTEVGFEPYSFDALTLPEFLREYCWVVFATGFRYSIVRAKSDELTHAFGGFDPDRILSLRLDVASLPMKHANKATGYLDATRSVIRYGFEEYRSYWRTRVEVMATREY